MSKTAKDILYESFNKDITCTSLSELMEDGEREFYSKLAICKRCQKIVYTPSVESSLGDDGTGDSGIKVCAVCMDN